MSEKWWDMSDDELDDLFREASDKAEIPFDSSALDKLRQKIDFKPTPQPSQGFKKRWLALTGLLIFFGVVLVYIFSGKNDDSTLENRPNVISKNELSSSTDSKASSSIEHKQNDISQKKDLSKSKNLPSNDKSAVIFDKSNSSKEKESKGNSTNSGSIIESKIIPNENATRLEKPSNKKRNEQEIKNGYSLNKKSFDKDLSNNISENNSLKNRTLDISNTKSFDEKTKITVHGLEKNQTDIIEINNSNSEENSSYLKAKKKTSKFQKSLSDNAQVSNPSVYIETNNPISVPFVIPENKPLEEETIVRTNFYNVDFLSNRPTKSLETNVTSEPPTYVNTQPVVMNQPKFSRFGIRLAIAPEVSSIGKMETSAVIGSLFGLFLEYRLTKKLTLQTGVNYSKKIYTGDFEYYRAWVGGTGTKPVNIDGNCKVLDIPINLRFNAFQMNRNTFFISGGVSSYLMSDEVYTYNYAWGPPKVREWMGSSSSFYWSTLNLSAGIERKMNKHFTLQVEPFLKTPLTGVGRGMVNLYSSGLLFSTKYEF
jgi:hypothetical protein